MSVRLIIALWLSSPVAIALVLCALHRRTLIGDRTDELSNQGADEGGRAFIQHNGERK